MREDLLDGQQHNSNLPSSRLPPEIMSRVFTILVSIDPPTRTVRPVKIRLGWLSITHVCKRWRDIALHLPTLWADITFPFIFDERWAAAFSSRARDMPLTIQY
ncbi:hypothetical protein FA95DRAFT_1496973, partial [Auriscalpium vulgare]